MTSKYPGDYVEETPSGARTITGVSTSVTAFVGAAKRGPINRPVRLLGMADFERRFGGLDDGSELSYAVRQFFLNGGAEAFAVRIAKSPHHARRGLETAGGAVVLTLKALDAGSAGNGILVRVDHATSKPGSTFNLHLDEVPEGEPASAVSETYLNLSMNRSDPRFAPDVVNASSALVRAHRPAGVEAALAAGNGTSRSGDLTGEDVTRLIDATHNALAVSLNGGPAKTVALSTPASNSDADVATALRAELQAAFGAANVDVAVGVAGGKRRITITSLAAGETSSVRVSPDAAHDVARQLKLGVRAGGEEVDAAALLRPAEQPQRAGLTGGALAADADLDEVPSVQKSFKIILDGAAADVTLPAGADLTGTLAQRLAALAPLIQNSVRAAGAGRPAFEHFTAKCDVTSKLILTSGTRGKGSSVQVWPSGADTLATSTKLTGDAGADASKARGVDLSLEGGEETEIADLSTAFAEVVGLRDRRTGLYALERVDLFNLLALPGITDPGVLAAAAAYCEERRAFLIVDSPKDADTPDEMEKAAAGADLPKTKNGAVYYPWIGIADPLAAGRLRTVAPAGTVAGLYARTDSTRGVWKAPAGTEASLVGAQAVNYLLTDRENDVLNPRGVNCLRTFPVFGAVAWGARTLVGDDQFASEWKYVPVRRLALYLEESLYRGTKWAVVEPNDEGLWAQLRLNIGAFLQDLFRQGAFAGQSPRDAYFVKCDRETTTQDDVNRGVVNVVVGFAPLEPAEFIVLNLRQTAGQSTT